MKYRIGAYARLSYDRNGDPISVETQHDDNRRTAAQRDWQITSLYTDNDLSAYKKGVVRPDFERMLGDLESGAIDGIIAYDLDRLWRRPTDLERVIDLYDGPYKPFATAQGDYDLSTSDGRTMARIMVAMANKSSSDTARRVKRKIGLQAQEGKPHWNTRPYGWNLDGSLYEPEAAVISQMVEWFFLGYTYRDIMARLNEMGARRRDGGLWENTKVKRILDSPRIAAIRVHDGVEYPGTWEPVISIERWQELKDAIKVRASSRRGVASNRRYLLTGVLICGNCEGHLSGMTKRDGFTKSLPKGRLRQTYHCMHCRKTSVGAEPLHHFIRELVTYRLDSVDLAQLLAVRDQDTGVDELMGERRVLTTRREAMMNDYADGTLTKADLKHVLARIDARLSALDADIDSRPVVKFNPALKPGETVREAWDTRNDGWKRQLLDVLTDKIVINQSSRVPYYIFDGKRTRFDADRVAINWKA